METADLGLGDPLAKDCKDNLLTSIPNDKLYPDESVITPSTPTCLRKRKADHEEAIECCPAPLKRRFETRVLMNELEAEGGELRCWCSERISLRIGTRLSLEHWEKHFLTCQHLKAKGITSFEDILSTAIDELHPPEIGTESSIEAGDDPLLPLASVDAPGISEKEEMLSLNSGEGTVARDTNSEQDTINGEDHRLKSGTEFRSPTQGLLKRRRPNRTEAERVQDFLDDSQVKELEPYRVLCRTCNKWIKLRNNSRYCSIPWKCHKSSCKPNTTPRGSRHATPLAGTSKLAPPPTQAETASLNSPSSQSTADFKVPPANMHPSLQINSLTLEQPSTSKPACSPKTRRPRLTDAENRKAVLEADSNVETVEPHRVLCALCKKWVKLRPNSTYCSAPWQSHIRRCLAKLDKKALKAQSSKKGTSRSGSGSTVGPSEDESTSVSPANRITTKRRNRPSKNKVAQNSNENNSESDRSYESEEE